jgi:NAD(P)-dependent dehydrogenase (short-subunit alcohol dehydrogenase family)
MDRRFTDRCAVVTGAGRGMGRAIAERLAAEGAVVVAADVDLDAAGAVAAAITATGGRAVATAVDVGDAQSVGRMATFAEAEAGGVDVLVNNAGILRSTAAAEITPAEWDLVLRIDLTGAFLCARALYPALRASGHGRIVNLASMAGRATSTLGGAHYTAAKAGVLGLSRHLAREWAKDGITVNAVSPGIVDTPMVRANTDDARLARVIESIPFGRLADPSEIAALVCFLASDEAAYITGANVDIHGGELIIA